MKKIIIPENYDYVGAYLTDKCHLNCSYCITKHHNSNFGKEKINLLTSNDWIKGLNRLILPKDVPLTLQGGEPFLYKGIWDILDNINHKVDILTAFPPYLTREHFLKLKTLEWNNREAPYPTIRVSYHKGQNNYKDLIERISKINDILSIGVYYLDHPENSEEDLNNIKQYANKYGVELRIKDFLGKHNGKTYGSFLYPDAVLGERIGINVLCKNTVVPISPDGYIYRCHSDLYFQRKDLSLGHILDEFFSFPEKYLPCSNFGLCSECDVKVKTNHYQQFGYTSVDIKKVAAKIAK